jgi:hypothetical protein
VSLPPSPYPTYPGAAPTTGRALGIRVLAQVDPDERARLPVAAALGGKHLLGEHASRLRLAHPARAGEEKRREGALAAEAGVVASQGPGDGVDDRLVSDDALPEPLLEREEPVAVRLQDPLFGDSGEPRHCPGHVVARHLRAAFPPRPRPGEIDGRERLVGKTPIVHVARGEERRRFQRLGREPHPVVLLVARRRSADDPQRLVRRRLAHEHRDESPLERGVSLDVPAELLVGRCADAGELAARERGLQLVRGILGPLARRARPDQHVHLVDEDDDAARGGADLLLDSLEALAEGAAKLRPGDERRDVDLHDDAIRSGLDEPPREPLHDGGLSYAGLADEERIVRAALAEDVEDLLDLGVPSQRRIELAPGREQAEVAAEGGEIRGAARIELVTS